MRQITNREELIEGRAFAMWRTRNPVGFIDTTAGRASFERQKSILIPYAEATVDFDIGQNLAVVNLEPTDEVVSAVAAENEAWMVDSTVDPANQLLNLARRLNKVAIKAGNLLTKTEGG